MTRPRRVLTVVVERCEQCRHVARWAHWFSCSHPNRPSRTEFLVDTDEPPPDWCPLPKEEER